MSQFQAIGETGLNEVLAKRLTTPGGAIAPAVAPEFFPVITLESERPEWGHLKGELLFSRAITPAVPVASSHVILRNPATSRTMAVAQRISALTTAGVLSVSLAPIGTFGTGVATAGGIPRDGRDTAFAGGIYTRTSQLQVFSLDAALSAVAEGFRSLTTTMDLVEPWIITPGMDLVIYGRTATAALLVNLFWRERAMQPGELV